MWNKEIKDELKGLVKEYHKKFGEWPHHYDELNYDAMTYDRFVGYIKKCLETEKEMTDPDIIPF